MLTEAIVIAALYACPGGEFTDEFKPGCVPFEQTGKEGFSRIQSEPSPPDPSSPASSGGPGSSPSGPGSVQQSPSGNSTNTELCRLYSEFVSLEVKTQGGVFMESTEQSQRYQTLKRMFQQNQRPSCP